MHKVFAAISWLEMRSKQRLNVITRSEQGTGRSLSQWDKDIVRGNLGLTSKINDKYITSIAVIVSHFSTISEK